MISHRVGASLYMRGHSKAMPKSITFSTKSKVNVAEIRVLRWMCEFTRNVRIIYKYVRESLAVPTMEGKKKKKISFEMVWAFAQKPKVDPHNVLKGYRFEELAERRD